MNNKIKLKPGLLAILVSILIVFIMIPPLEAHAATTVTLKPGETYDFSKKSDYKKYGALYVDINRGGKYTLTGASQGQTKNTMLRIDAPKGETVLVYLKGVDLAPNDTAPGSASSRAAVEILDGGGTVILYSQETPFGNTFRGQGHMPAIRKDNTNTKLVFESKNDHPGTIVARADPDGFRTCAIGGYSPNIAILSSIFAKGSGNIEFNHGIVEAHGSKSRTKSLLGTDFDGGPAIGINGYGSVKDITVNGGHILAYPGDATAAGIGTGAATYYNALGIEQSTIGSEVRDLTINGGTIDVIYDEDTVKGDSEDTQYRGGAAIGSGWRSDVENITINGGTINIATQSESAGMPWTGIGAGAEGNAHGIKINDGTIRIKARYTGIGGGYSPDFTNFDLIIPPPWMQQAPIAGSKWFGECRADISGGDIKIRMASKGVGIGSWKQDSKYGYVEITGGEIDVDAKPGGAAIGTAHYGKLHHITIRGGHITAHNHDDESNSTQCAVIGSCVKEWGRPNGDSFVEYIQFTGGTVTTDPTSEVVGGWSNETWSKHTRVLINGGNLNIQMADGVQPYSRLSRGVDVSLQTIELAGGELTGSGTSVKQGDIPLKHADGDVYQYGLKDVLVKDSTPQLYFWVPEDAELGSVEVKDSIFKDLDSRAFYGAFKAAGGKSDCADVAFYPPIHLNLTVNDAYTHTDGNATVLYGSKKLSEFNPGKVDGWVIEKYNSKYDGSGVPVLSGGGKLIQSNDQTFVNKDGRWVYAPEDMMPELFTEGRNLYATKSDFDLRLTYDENIPEKTQSELTGDMPDEAEYKASDSITLPTGGRFALKGYQFTGWNTAADGSGTAYESGQGGLTVHDFRKTSDDDGDISLFAQWEPIKYKITYRPNQPDAQTLKDVDVEYTYDEKARFADGDSLRAWGGWRNSLAGWKTTIDDEETLLGKNDEFINFLDFDANGNPAKPRILIAQWIDQGGICIRITEDGKGVSDIASDIVLKSEEGTEYKNYFTEQEGLDGYYVKKSNKELHTDDYTIHVKNRRVDKKKSAFSYFQNETYYIELASFTTTLEAGKNCASVSLSETDGTDDYGRPYVVAPAGYEIGINAKATAGYKLSGWNCDGVMPEGFDKDKAEQTVKVRGRAVLSIEAKASHYTVVFDANDHSYPDAEPATGEMDPQEFVVGKAQNLSGTAFKRKGYSQRSRDKDYAWSIAPDMWGRCFWDEHEIPADAPITREDGATVTLYAIWEPKTYTVTFKDPSGTFADGQQEVSYDDGQYGMPSIPDNKRLPGWTERKGYKLYGWKEAGAQNAKIYEPGEAFKNLCTVNENGSLTGKTMEAVWAADAAIVLNISKDGEKYTGNASKIKLQKGNNVYEDYFTEDENIPGRYVYNYYILHELRRGDYDVLIDGFDIPQEKRVISFEPGKTHITIDYDFFTVEVEKGDHITSATVNDQASAVVLKDEKALIKATAEGDENAGYRFDKWSWPEGQSRPQWEAGKDETAAEQSVTVQGTTKLTAHARGIDYTVAFHANDESYPGTDAATGTMEDQSMVYGEQQRLRRAKYDKKGYLFHSWNTKRDGSGTTYGNGQSVKNLTATDGAVVDLYAQWEPRTYTLIFKDPYRLCDTEKKTVKYNEPVALIEANDDNWTPAGHVLFGWNSDALGSFYEPGQVVKNLCVVNPDGTLSGRTLYARWNDIGSIMVSITLDGEGIDVDPDDIELISEDSGAAFKGCFVKSDETVGLYMYHADPAGADDGPLPVGNGLLPEGNYMFHLNHYDSYGLADKRVKTRYGYDTATSVFLASDTVTIEAGEHVRSVNITKSGEDTAGNSIVLPDGEKAVISAVVDEEGYHFDSYEVEGVVDMDPAKADQTITVYSAVNLRAKAAPNPFYIHFDANGGTGEMLDQMMTYDAANNLTANTFTRQHYTFTGWNTEADGSGKNFADREDIGNLSDKQGETITLYAQWKEKPKHYITFNLNGGTLDGKTGKIVMECYEDDVITVLDAPTRKGYKFMYWKGSKYYPKDKYTVKEDHTLTAEWEKIRNPNPDNPDDPDNPNDHGGTNTGDESHILLWLALMTLSMLGLTITVLTRCRHN